MNGSDVFFDVGLLNAAKFITIYIQPLVCTIGILGNSMAVIVFLSREMRKVSSNIYLTGLSVSCILFLQALFVVWLEVVELRLFHQQVWCQIVVFVSYVSTFLTVWFVVCITFENYIVMFHIDKATRICTVVKARIIVGCLTVFAILIYSFVLWSANVENVKGTDTCTSSRAHLHVTVAFTFLDTVVALILPITSIFAMIFAIIVKHLTHRWRTAKLNAGFVQQQSNKERRLMKITRVLLAISISYLLLDSPLYINKIRYLVNSSLHVAGNKVNEESLNQIFHNVFYLSFCTNFVFYLLWGNNFKKNLAKLFCLERCRFKRYLFRRLTSKQGTMLSRLDVPINDRALDAKPETLKLMTQNQTFDFLRVPDKKDSDNSVISSVV